MADGSYYEGEYKNGNRHGAGSMYMPDGNVYVGSWENDQKHGIGNLFDFTNQTK